MSGTRRKNGGNSNGGSLVLADDKYQELYDRPTTAILRDSATRRRWEQKCDAEGASGKCFIDGRSGVLFNRQNGRNVEVLRKARSGKQSSNSRQARDRSPSPGGSARRGSGSGRREYYQWSAEDFDDGDAGGGDRKGMRSPRPPNASAAVSSPSASGSRLTVRDMLKEFSPEERRAYGISTKSRRDAVLEAFQRKMSGAAR